MSKHVSGRPVIPAQGDPTGIMRIEADSAPAQPIPFPGATGPTQRAWSARRIEGGLWLSEFAEVPMDVFQQYVVKRSSPDILAMVVGGIELDLYKQPERP